VSLRRDLAWTAATLLALLAWEASGLDLALIHHYGGEAGFALRDHALLRDGVHEGGRWLSAALLLALAVDLVRPLLPGPTGPARGERAWWLGATLGGIVLVPLLKRFSSTSCPWDVAGLGGSVPYVPHWLLQVADGGPGHCFPSGHAVAAFAFFSLHFLWRPWRPALARALLAGVLIVGLVFAWGQMARGAHYASHSLWSAWLCWALNVAAAALRERLKPRATLPTTHAWPTTATPQAPTAPSGATAVIAEPPQARRARSAG
jgi:membrane-associated PAP2 superfamily phosphatase